jgi:hypothetical protein
MIARRICALINHRIIRYLFLHITASSTTTAPAPAGGLFGSTPAPSTTTDAAPTPAAGGLFGAGEKLLLITTNHLYCWTDII